MGKGKEGGISSLNLWKKKKTLSQLSPLSKEKKSWGGGNRKDGKRTSSTFAGKRKPGGKKERKKEGPR